MAFGFMKWGLPILQDSVALEFFYRKDPSVPVESWKKLQREKLRSVDWQFVQDVFDAWFDELRGSMDAIDEQEARESMDQLQCEGGSPGDIFSLFARTNPEFE